MSPLGLAHDQQDALQILLLKLELSLIGCCIYQGEELALDDVRDIPLEKMKDPWGIEFAPIFLGRDTCRTPMVWQGDLPNGGFTTAEEPRLPVAKGHLQRAGLDQAARSDSVYNQLSEFLDWRKHQPALTEEQDDSAVRRARQIIFDRIADRRRCAAVLISIPSQRHLRRCEWPQVELKDVNKAFGKIDVIRNVELEINKGEFVVFVGPSGCGKSTLLRLIAGLESLTSGEIIIADRPVMDLPPSKRGIAMVFQSYALYPHMTVFHNMAFSLNLQGFSKAEIRERVEAAAKILQMEHLLDRRPAALSGGQRRVWPLAGQLFVIRMCFCLMSPYQILMPRCDMTHVKRLPNFITSLVRPQFM